MLIVLVAAGLLTVVLVLLWLRNQPPATQFVRAPGDAVFDFLLDNNNFAKAFGGEGVEIDAHDIPLSPGQTIKIRTGSNSKRVSGLVIVEQIQYPTQLITRLVFYEIGGEESADFPEFKITQEIQETNKGSKVTISMIRVTECPVFLQVLAWWMILKSRGHFINMLNHAKSSLER